MNVNDDDVDPGAAALEAFGARHVPARLRHVPGILARRLWQLNQYSLWYELREAEADRTHLRPGSALRCITLLPLEYVAEGLTGAFNLSPWEFQYEGGIQGLEDTIRAIALNGHAQILDDIAKWNRVQRGWYDVSDGEEPNEEAVQQELADPTWLALPLREADVDACARLGLTATLEVLHRRVPRLFSPFALRVLQDPTSMIAHVQDPQAAPEDEPTPVPSRSPPPTVTHSVFLDVLTNPMLLACIGAFQFDIHVWIAKAQLLYDVWSLYGASDSTIDGIVGILPRLAIIRGDESVLRRLYQLAMLPEYTSIPKFSFVNAMHDAATEGHLAMLQWLHTLRPRLSCRPDTMAMTVRSGWADVVEWLCEHAREPACFSMSDASVCDAARWGFLDVLRVLHEQGGDAWFSSSVMDSAAESGQVEVVQWLHGNRSEGCTTKALDGAIDMNHPETVKWLHANRTEGCSKEAMGRVLVEATRDPMNPAREELVDWFLANRHEKCTGEALCSAIASGNERRLDITLRLWARSRDDPEVDIGIQTGFKRACATVVDTRYIQLLLERLGDLADVQVGILAASSAQNGAVVEFLVPLVSPQVAVRAGVNADLGHVVREAVTQIRDNGETVELGDTLREAIRKRKYSAISASIELGVEDECPDALSFAVEASDPESVRLLLGSRYSADDVLRILPMANSREVVQVLLEHESMRPLDSTTILEAFPSCLATQFVRHVARHGRSTSILEAVRAMAMAGPRTLLVDELATIADMQDPDLDAFLSRHHATIIRPNVLLKPAAQGDLALMKYLHARGVAVTAAIFNPALGEARVHVVEWLLSLGLEMPAKWIDIFERRPTHPMAQALAAVHRSTVEHTEN